MTQTADSMTDDEIREAGLDALVEALGPVGMARFLKLMQSDIRDYTAERHKWLKSLTIDELLHEARPTDTR
jgi:hypothetical protein